MQIQSINNNVQNYKIKKTTKNNTKILYKNDSISLNKNKEISFGSFQQLQLKVQAKNVEKNAELANKMATLSQNDAHSILLDATELQQEAKYIQENAPKILKRAQAIYKHGQANNFKNITDKKTGALLRQYYDGDDGSFIIEDHGDKEKTIRKIIFNKHVTMIMELNSQTQIMDAFSFDTQTNELLQYAKGIKIDFNGYSAQKVFNYEDGKLSTCDIKYKMVEDGFEKAQKHYVYQNDKLAIFDNDWLYRENKSLNCGERFIFDDVMLKKVSIGLEKESGKSYKSAEEYIYCEDNYLETYIKNLCMSAGKNNAMKAVYKFGEEGLERAYLNAETSNFDKKTTAQKLFLFKIYAPTRCRFDYEITNDGKESHSQVITLEK